MPLVTVVIPCWNDGRFLPTVINSVRSQSYKDIEIVVVDDGSNDPVTREVLLGYIGQVGIVRVPHGGLARTRNAGIERAKGEYILPLDADDVIEKTYIEKAVEILESRPDIKIVYCGARFFGGKLGNWNLPEYTKSGILKRNMIFASALFRKKDWESVGGYNPNMIKAYEDWDFWLSILENVSDGVYRIPERLFYYRIRKGAMHHIGLWWKILMRLRLYLNHKRLFLRYAIGLNDE